MTAFDLVKLSCLGSDIVYSARAMMLALGCIQALECNKTICPVGIATQRKDLIKGLDPIQKGQRVANFHHETVHAVAEILCASGLSHTEQLERKHIWRRINPTEIANFEQLYPEPSKKKAA